MIRRRSCRQPLRDTKLMCALERCRLWLRSGLTPTVHAPAQRGLERRIPSAFAPGLTLGDFGGFEERWFMLGAPGVWGGRAEGSVPTRPGVGFDYSTVGENADPAEVSYDLPASLRHETSGHPLFPRPCRTPFPLPRTHRSPAPHRDTGLRKPSRFRRVAGQIRRIRSSSRRGAPSSVRPCRPNRLRSPSKCGPSSWRAGRDGPP